MKAIAWNLFSGVGGNPDPFAPKGTNWHSKDDYYNSFDSGNFNLLEIKPLRIDKNTTNDNMKLIRVIEQKASTRQEMTKTRMQFQPTDLDTGNQWLLELLTKGE